jgi:hypothetical protein
MSLQHLPEQSAPEPIGAPVIISAIDAVRDPMFAFEDLPTYHPDALKEREALQRAKRAQVSHYRMTRSRWWEVTHYERIEEDIEKTITVTSGSEFELSSERKSSLTAKLGFELGYPDIAKITGEIEYGLELTDKGTFKQTASRTVEMTQKLRGGYLYFFWQVVEAIQLERRRFGKASYELVSEVLGRSSEVIPVRVRFREADSPTEA